MMRIECVYYEGCGSRQVLPHRLDLALAQARVEADVTHRTILLEDGLRLGVPGSPTILVDGEDILGAAGQGGT